VARGESVFDAQSVDSKVQIVDVRHVIAKTLELELNSVLGNTGTLTTLNGDQLVRDSRDGISL
jgi:hypothetical protein